MSCPRHDQIIRELLKAADEVTILSNKLEETVEAMGELSTQLGKMPVIGIEQSAVILELVRTYIANDIGILRALRTHLYNGVHQDGLN